MRKLEVTAVVSAFICSIIIVWSICFVTQYSLMVNGEELARYNSINEINCYANDYLESYMTSNGIDMAKYEKGPYIEKRFGLGKSISSNIIKATAMRKLDIKEYGAILIIDREEVLFANSAELIQEAINLCGEELYPGKEFATLETYQIKSFYGVVSRHLKRCNGTESIVREIMHVPLENRVHVVEKGDTLYAIARTNGTSVDKIIADNPSINPDRISIGDEVLIKKEYSMLTFVTK